VDSDAKVAVSISLAMVVVVGVLMFGAVKGCQITENSSDIQDGRRRALHVKCLDAGFTPLECNSSSGKYKMSQKKKKCMAGCWLRGLLS